MGAPAILDHVVLAGPDLAATIDEVELRTGVRAPLGGRHPGGTANALIGFTRGGRRVKQYLELIGPDAEGGWAASEIGRFGIAELPAPAVVSFAIAPHDLDATVERATAAGAGIAALVPLSRRTPDGRELAWRLGLPEDERQPPFLIDWGDTAHPALDDIPALELLAVRRLATDVAAETARLRALGVEVGDGRDALEVVAADADGIEIEVEVDGLPVVLR
ncbi:VOC family protein [Agrococcus jenensis]|uniref:Glyoxalase-like protein n=1 Tax=Agrococcus jenensis TaxID=46353 RepID=A0A3N2AV46_9MICO|nr:VOC family protein [Agrococcus jenensis]ROR66850.1 glyoxalase-like protein [Agrococcus jenensis]